MRSECVVGESGTGTPSTEEYHEVGTIHAIITIEVARNWLEDAVGMDMVLSDMMDQTRHLDR